MDWSNFQSKKVALVGSGRENLAILPYLKKTGADITLHEWEQGHIPEDLDIKTRSGDEYLNDLGSYDILIRAPGFPVKTVKEALKDKEGPILTSTVDIFLGMTKSYTIGVTGTKGKGTTVTILDSILRAAGKKTFVIGNIGEGVFSRFDDIDENSISLIELSSFQLEDIKHSPHLAIILPITPDHLKPLSSTSPNYHDTLEDYASAKSNIVKYQSGEDICVYDADNENSDKIGKSSLAKQIALTLKDIPDGNFRDIDLKKNGFLSEYIWVDAGLAILAAIELGIDKETIEKGLSSYKALPHRIEKFYDKNEIVCVDDSYATTPESTMAAIESFTNPIILIAGGSTKGVSFDELAQKIAKSSVKSVILMGQEADKISKALEGVDNLKIEKVQSLQEAVNIAVDDAASGDVIMLSPACASTDMFKNAAERGDLFKKMIDEVL